MIQFRSFKFRLTVGYALMLTVFLGGFAFLMYAELSRALYHDVESSMAAEALDIEAAIMNYLQELRDPQMRHLPDLEKGLLLFPPDFQEKLDQTLQDWESRQRRINRSLFLIRVLGLNHSLIVFNRGGWEGDILFPNYERDSVFMEKGRSYQTIHFQKRAIRLYYHLVRAQGKPLLIIQIAKPLYEIERTLGRLALIISLIIPLGVALACLAGWLLAKHFLSPVDRMIHQARSITAAYLKNRLPRTMTHDELDRLAETLNEMIDRLERSTRMIQEFSSNVSHEFKTPLAIIRGEIDLAFRRERSPQDLQQAMEVISEEVDGLIRLVDDLMLLVRSDAKQLQMRKNRIFLLPILKQVIKLYQDRARRENITLNLNASKDFEIMGDEMYLKRLFTNLVDNAIKFTDLNGEVTVTMSGDAWHAVVEVTDTGIGIDPETLANLGKRFYRADQARSKEGAGLGLSIVKAICDSHQSTLQIESVVATGTKVTIKIPHLIGL